MIRARLTRERIAHWQLIAEIAIAALAILLIGPDVLFAVLHRVPA